MDVSLKSNTIHQWLDVSLGSYTDYSNRAAT